MAITVECPGGHTIRVKDEYAGKTGYCPRCKAKIRVPGVRSLSDDDILAIVRGRGSSKPEAEPAVSSESVLDDQPSAENASGLSLLGSSKVRGQKVCPGCYQLASFAFSVCPTCGTRLPDRPTDDEALPAEARRNRPSHEG